MPRASTIEDPAKASQAWSLILETMSQFLLKDSMIEPTTASSRSTESSAHDGARNNSDEFIDYVKQLIKSSADASLSERLFTIDGDDLTNRVNYLLEASSVKSNLRDQSTDVSIAGSAVSGANDQLFNSNVLGDLTERLKSLLHQHWARLCSLKADEKADEKESFAKFLAHLFKSDESELDAEELNMKLATRVLTARVGGEDALGDMYFPLETARPEWAEVYIRAITIPRGGLSMRQEIAIALGTISVFVLLGAIAVLVRCLAKRRAPLPGNAPEGDLEAQPRQVTDTPSSSNPRNSPAPLPIELDTLT
ncbi:hypothetical protein QFC21_006107 [Naganishia friedmannii]|uniref:Uncharacterized protein n=1 Tax=Naganishia friedmannii TaxID=89922 RepID=A0ACC2V5G2_9TREE|nr:hypothetical protein QFC21_006107 [Naganishia friedmannii]